MNGPKGFGKINGRSGLWITGSWGRYLFSVLFRTNIDSWSKPFPQEYVQLGLLHPMINAVQADGVNIY